MSEIEDLYDEVAPEYDHFHVDAKSLAENRYVEAFLARWLRPKERVVDLGCGTGLLLDLVHVPPEQYVGVDLSGGMLERARQKHPGHTFIQADIQQPIPGLEAGTFQAAVSLFGSMSYCALDPAYAELRRLLAPGGRYFTMLCGPRYLSRDTYIHKHVAKLMPRSAQEIRAVFRPEAIWGMSRFADRLPASLPGPLMDRVVRLEAEVIGRRWPDGFFFINAVGRV